MHLSADFAPTVLSRLGGKSGPKVPRVLVRRFGKMFFNRIDQKLLLAATEETVRLASYRHSGSVVNGGSPVRKSRTLGSVRGASSNGRPYRNRAPHHRDAAAGPSRPQTTSASCAPPTQALRPPNLPPPLITAPRSPALQDRRCEPQEHQAFLHAHSPLGSTTFRLPALNPLSNDMQCLLLAPRRCFW